MDAWVSKSQPALPDSPSNWGRRVTKSNYCLVHACSVHRCRGEVGWQGEPLSRTVGGSLLFCVLEQRKLAAASL